MICKHCGVMIRDNALTCDYCGAYLGPVGMEQAHPSETGAASIRQGRDGKKKNTAGASRSIVYPYGNDQTAAPLPEGHSIPDISQRSAAFENYGSSRPDVRSDPFVHTDRITLETEKNGDIVDLFRQGRDFGRKKMNWARVLIAAFVILVVGYAGYTYYMSKSDVGMSAIARENTLNASEEIFALAASSDYRLADEKEKLLEQWNKADPRIYWNVADEYLEMGDVPMAIQCFRIAALLEPDNYDGIMALADAYQLNQQDDQAEALYLYLTQEVSTFRTDAYSALISMYEEQGRAYEVAEMLKTAYNNTDNINFALQRRDYVPAQPEINLTAGRYELNESGLKGRTYDVNGVPVPINQITLSSPQGYDIYYTLDEKAKLPEEGTLYTEGVKLEEGTVAIRAVCVSEELYSDEISVSYTFFYPTPPAPKANLAPNTYAKLKTVSLRAGEINDENMTNREKKEAEKYYTYYYTIDGSTPSTNSPMYDGTPIVLPSGRVTLRAICVNQYGKSSSVATIGYKFNVKPYPNEAYQEADQFGNFVLNKTDINTFQSTFGQPKETLQTRYLNLENEAKHMVYDWGYAVFILDGTSWVLVRVEMTSGFTTNPRGIKLGATEQEVCDAYKDFGQPNNQDGSRGLYNDYPSVGSIIIRPDGQKVIQYTLQTETSHMWVLQYWLNAHGTVNKICHYYQP